ncbi:hypothetical protein ACCUM_0078 [Candidatus Accumulibacter phosphatis]|uniref:Uncharacterized protein n=1 Tax=Candidatus Accumulibacter phosphatis TaxID=327160 RepID=A0A5S4ELD1_9PROT|nr:hypothetical protein ACCUM_0078 [Candidatus Accumulibacter phosphatis]
MVCVTAILRLANCEHVNLLVDEMHGDLFSIVAGAVDLMASFKMIE